MKRHIFFLTLFLFIGMFIGNAANNTLYGQIDQDWAKRYNGPGYGNDVPSSIAVDGAGNVYVTGSSTGNGTNKDFTTIKYNLSGVQQWVARYNGTGNDVDEAYSIVVDRNSNVYITGLTTSDSSTGPDYATIKYNSSGVQQWIAKYNGPDNAVDQSNAIAVDSSGNVYVTGYSYSLSSHYDYVTIKYNSSGVQQWAKRYNGIGGNDDWAFSVAVDGSGNVYVTGGSIGNSPTFDYLTIKYNSSGSQLWEARYNGPADNSDIAGFLVLDHLGNVYITGSSASSGNSTDYATVKYNSSGVQQWVARYSGTGTNLNTASAITLDSFGNVFVTGRSMGNGTNYDYATLKYNSAGVQQWAARYNGPGNSIDFARSVTTDTTGNIYVTGESTGSGTDYDYTTIKYNSTGVQQWLVRYNGPGNSYDGARMIAVDKSGNVYVTGASTGSGTSQDFLTIKYSQPIGIHKISSEIPDKYLLQQNYPNPFNPATNIIYQIPEAGNIKLVIVDLLGREITTLVNEFQRAGTYSVEFDGSELSSGIYFYRLISRNYSDTRKMILMK